MTAEHVSADQSKRGDRVATRGVAASAAEEYLTTEELAALLKVPVRTVHHWRYRGESPPAVKIRGTLRFPLSGVQAWIKANTETTHAH
jgi:excisionase family DNA binding protein